MYTFQSYIGIRPDIITLCGSRALQHNMDLDKNCRNLSGGSSDTPNYKDLIEFDFWVCVVLVCIPSCTLTVF